MQKLNWDCVFFAGSQNMNLNLQIGLGLVDSYGMWRSNPPKLFRFLFTPVQNYQHNGNEKLFKYSIYKKLELSLNEFNGTNSRWVNMKATYRYEQL